MIGSLQSRLLLAVGALAVCAVAAVAIAARQGTRQEFFRLQETERRAASAVVAGLADSIVHDIGARCCDEPAMRAAAARLAADQAVLVVDLERGALIAAAGTPVERMQKLTTQRIGNELAIEADRRNAQIVQGIGLRVKQNGAPLRRADGTGALLYVVRFPNEDHDRRVEAFLGSIDRRLIAVTSLVAGLAVAATWIIAGGIIKPLRELRAAALDVSRGHPVQRVVPRGGRELAELARTFNAMAADLERQRALQRSVVRDVAHELRTPLTALRCHIETVIDGLAPDPARAVRDVHDEVLHLGRLVDDLQELVLAEAHELRLDIRDVPLAGVIASALRATGLETDPRVRLELSLDGVVRADPVRVRQMMLNLLTNADRYTPAGGCIVVLARDTVNEIEVEVCNSGMTLEAEQVDHLFERFYRTDPSRQRVTGGTGLGLAIVKSLAEAQGGSVWARSDQAAVVVGFRLPRASA